MTLGKAKSVHAFNQAANEFGFTFNWVYANRRQTAYFSSGRLPKRPSGTNKLLPTLGTGAYEWRGFLSQPQHPHATGGPSGLFLNWNNKPAPGWQTGDDNHGYGAIHRVQMFDDFPERSQIEDVVSIMNRAATEDLRGTKIWPTINAVLQGGPPPSALAGQAADLVTAWSTAGGSRLASDVDGKVDDPGAAIMADAWNRIADAVMTPRARTAHRRPREPRAARQHGTERRLVRVRRQGPANAARPARARQVQAPLLRRRVARRVPHVAVGGDRRRRERPGRDPGSRPLEVARRQHAHHLRSRVSSRTRCASRTAPPSSR